MLSAFPVVVADLLPEFMTPEGHVLLWSIIVFLVLLALLWKMAWGPIMHALEAREQGIQKHIDDAEKRFKDAEAKAAEYEKKINTAKDEAAALIAEGKRDVEKLKAEIIADAQKEAAVERERAKKEIGLARDAAVAEIRERVVKLSSEMTSRLIQREIKADDHKKLVEEAIAELEKSANS